MIRKPPIRTYQKKKTAQSSFCYSQTSSWEPRYFSKRVSTNSRKSKPQSPTRDDKDIEEFSPGYLETTFDRIAKDVKLPPLPPQQNSNVTLNISSDVPPSEPSPIKNDVFEFPWTIKAAKVERKRRKPVVQSRPVYNVEAEIVVKKRLKHDLMNTSVKTDKAVRNSRRKVSNKNGKDLIDGKEKEEIQITSLNLNNSENWFAEPQAKSNETIENGKKKKNGYILRKKKNAQKALISNSCNESDSGDNRSDDIDKTKIRNKIKKKRKNVGRRKIGTRKLESSVSFDIGLKEINDSSKSQEKDNEDREGKDFSVENFLETKNDKSSLVDSCHSVNRKKISILRSKTKRKTEKRNSSGSEFVSNFRKYSASKSRENNDQDPWELNKYNRILTREQYISKIQSKLMKNKNSQECLKNFKSSMNDVTGKDDLATKPCSVLLLKLNDNENPLPSGKQSAIESQTCNMESSEDIFQSSISNAASDTEPEIHYPTGMGSAETRQPQSTKNQSDIDDNSNLDTEPREVKFSKEIIDRKDSNRSLHYLKCSTPINANIKIDKTINCLSPITASDGTLHKNEKLMDENEVYKTWILNSSSNGRNRRDEKSSDLSHINTRRRSARKRLSISYEGDDSLEMSDECCKENKIDKNNVNRNGNEEQMKSPTSKIQESLEILKLNLEDSIHDKSKLKLSGREILSKDDDGSDKIFESTVEMTSQSKDTCSQLTPAGIITTRSGRQLKLNISTHKKFFNDSNDSKIHSDDDNEIINDSETARTKNPKSRVTRSHGNRLTVSKFNSKRNISDYAKSSIPVGNDSPKIETDMKIPNLQTSNNSATRELMNFNASRKLKRTPLHRISKNSSQDYGKSILEDNRRRTRASVASDLQNQCSKISSEEISNSIIESTEILDSLNIRSEVDVETESLGKNNDNSDSEWSTLSESMNMDSGTSNLEEKRAEVSCEENISTNLSDSFISDENEPEIGPLSIASDHSFKSPDDFSPKYTELALTDRMKLLSTRINTRKRRKTSMKPLKENNSQVIEERPSSDDSKLTNSLHACSRNGSNSQEENEIDDSADALEKEKEEPNDTELLDKEPLHMNINANLQPLVLLEKLKEPFSMKTRKKTEDLNFGEAAIHEITNENLEIIRKNSKESFMIPDTIINDTDNEIDEDYEEFEKSDSLYCPPDESDIDNSSLRENITSTAHTECNHSKLESLNVSALIKRQSVFSSLRQSIITRSKKSDLSPKANESIPKRSEKRNSTSKANATCALKTNSNDTNLDLSDPEQTGRQSLFLKPGKDWARSLSILNNIQNGSDLEQLSNGKGKNWRQSVQAVLAMQQEGLLQSCTGKNQDDKDTQTRYLRSLDSTSIPNRSRTPCSEEQSIRSSSPSRFIKRMSIRVVPDNKRLSKIQDTSFLEAYGITPSKSRNTFSRTSEFESAEKTLTCNLQSEDAASESINTERIVTARDVVLQRCDQDDYISFAKCFPPQYLHHCRKIGEGVYGEVFLYENWKEKSVIKIIPIEGEKLVNGERQKRFDEILSEIVIAKKLHDLRDGDKYQTHGFVEVKNIRCIQGKYPEKLIDLWKAYDNDKGSDNDCPSMFDRNQLYIVLELGHGGEDLEAFVFSSSIEAHALFVQAAVALAVAEQSLEFEHRDLHWGNVLISKTSDTEVAYKLNNEEYSYPTKGLQVAIIDFTLSRMSYDGCCIFNDLALDPALFTAQGEYQFEIYRLMRDKIGNDWQQFEPYTNILWLHYTIDKMMTSLRYKKKHARGHREGLCRLHELKEVVLNYNSAFDFVTNCEKITNLQCKSTSQETNNVKLKLSKTESDH